MSIGLAAVVADSERPALVAAAEQLRESLSHATGADWPVALRFRDALEAIDLPPERTIVVASLLPELEREHEPWAQTEARWRASLTALSGRFLSVFVCTIFRYLADERGQRITDVVSSRLERLRRLDLLAAELSHDTGAGVADIDRVFAHVGARKLATDYRLAGAAAAEIAGYTIVASILAVGLDTVIAPEVQARAEMFQGLLPDLGALLARRLPAATTQA